MKSCPRRCNKPARDSNRGRVSNEEDIFRDIVGLQLYVGPTLSGYLLFVLGPLIAAILLSFTHYDMMSPPRLIGFSNYARLFSDARLAVVYKNTALFAVMAVVLTVGIGTLLGIALNKRLPGFLKYILRTAYFFPVLVGMIYAAMVWKFLFNRDLGVVNYYLHFFYLPPIPWLTSTAWAIWSVILVYVWKNVGFTMLTTLAGLQSISEGRQRGERVISSVADIRLPWEGRAPCRPIFLLLLRANEKWDGTEAVPPLKTSIYSLTPALYS